MVGLGSGSRKSQPLAKSWDFSSLRSAISLSSVRLSHLQKKQHILDFIVKKNQSSGKFDKLLICKMFDRK